MNPSATPGEPPMPKDGVLALKKLGLIVILILLFTFWHSTGIVSVIALMIVYWPLWVPWLIGRTRSKRGSAPVAPTSEQRRKKWLNLALNGYFGLGLFFWPVAVFLTFFAFDSPPTTPLGWMWAWTFVISVWCYPVFWAAGLFFGLQSVKRDEATWRVVHKSSIPLLSGLWLVVFGLVVGFWEEMPMFAPPRPNQPPAATRPAQ